MRDWDWIEKLEGFLKTSVQGLIHPTKKSLAIDLGAANTRVYTPGHGVLIDEPSMIALDIASDRVAAVGQKAKALVRRQPRMIHVSRPIQGGVIADCEVAGLMLGHFIGKSLMDSRATNLSLALCVPSDITPLEQKAYEDAAIRAGARKVTLIETPYAVALGANFIPKADCACMVVDVGAATTDVAVVNGDGIIHASTRRIGGREMDRAIQRYLQLVRTLEVSEETAEEIKIRLGGVSPLADGRTLAVRGRNLKTGLPEEITVGSEEIHPLILPVLRVIKQHVRATLDEIPTGASVDLLDSGIILSGGLTQLDGLAEALQQELKLQVRVAPDPTLAAVLGAGHILEYEPQTSPRAAFKEQVVSRCKWPITGQ
jgi:rod shape-determining protein MreB